MTNTPAIAAAVESLRVDGFAVVDRVLDDAERGRALVALHRIAASERVDGTAILEDGLAADGRHGPGVNQRVLALVGKDEVFRRIATAPIAVDVARRMFGASYGFPADVVQRLALDDVLLSSFTANIARRGGLAMTQHADQGFMPPSTPYPILLNVVWPLVDFTSENGATRVVPGSHRRDPRSLSSGAGEPAPVVAHAGSAIFIDGRTWHGTGANRTDEPRPALLVNYCPPWVRPFSNHLLELDPEILETATGTLLDLLGCRQWFVHGRAELAHLARATSVGR